MSLFAMQQKSICWGVKMEAEDLQFYENQKCTPPIGHCTNTIDKHSLAKTRRMKKRTARETAAQRE